LRNKRKRGGKKNKRVRFCSLKDVACDKQKISGVLPSFPLVTEKVGKVRGSAFPNPPPTVGRKG